MIDTRRISLEASYSNIQLAGQVGAEIENITYVDNAADNSDSIDISLNAQEGKWIGAWFPEKGATLQPKIKGEHWERNGDTRILQCGLFVLDNIDYSDVPAVLQLGGVSKPGDTDFSEQEREYVWKNTSIKRIGETIAKRYGLGFGYDADDYDIECSEQDGTDSSFYNGICKNYGLILKVYANRLWVYDREKYKEKKAVKSFYPYTIKRGSLKYTTSLFGTFTGGTFSYTDPDKDIDIFCSIGTAVGASPSSESSNTGSIPNTCRYGMVGDTVKLMQEYLMQLGYDLAKYGADGSFGPETRAAVKAFQTDHPPLEVDGICGPKTWAALLEAIAQQNSVSSESGIVHNAHTKNVNRAASSVYDASVQLCAEINNANHGAEKLKFSTDGEWSVSAGNCIMLEGYGALSGKYFVDKITHKYTKSSGFTSDFECSRVRKPFYYWEVGGDIEYHENEDASSEEYKDNYSSTSPAASASSAAAGAEAGQSVSLSNAPFYYSSTAASPSVYKSGTFYFYDGILINGRYRITNTKDRCGKLPVGQNVTGWVPASYCGDTGESPNVVSKTVITGSSTDKNGASSGGGRNVMMTR